MNDQTADRTRILLVEDERSVRLVLAEILNANGYTVRQSESADDAMELLTGRPEFDLIITDIQMPGRADGLALADDVASREPALPVLIMTGSPGLMRRPLRDNEAFLAKPFAVGDLITKLRQLDTGRTLHR